MKFNMKDNIDNKISCKDTINFKVGFTFFLYIICFLVYYFVGIKSNDKERKNYNDLPIFLTILLYVYNCYIFYSYTQAKSEPPCAKIIWLQAGLFYILNLVIMYSYFNPLEKEKELTVDPSGNTLEYIYKDNKWGVFAGISIFGLIAFVIGILTFIPEFNNVIPNKFLQTVIKLFIVLFVFFGLLFVTIYFFIHTPWSLTLIINILNIVILIGLLSVIYALSKDLFKKSENKSSFIFFLKLLIFYIPCLFSDFITYIKNQIGLTKSTTWIILLIEALLIGLRILVPFLFKQIKKVTSIDGDLIKKGPIYTNKETDLGVFLCWSFL